MAANAPELRPPLAVVCHDAGACNLILPWLAPPGHSPPAWQRPVMQGPAAQMFRARFGLASAGAPGSAPEPRPPAAQESVLESALAFAVESALDGAAMLLSGTGWASDLEHRARRLARQRGIFSVAVIDHWVNYPNRFERAGEVIWPDEFWVTDDQALALARQAFAGATVRCFDNLYLSAEATAAGPLPCAAAQLLYVLEPMRSDWGRGVPGEFQALDRFVRLWATGGVAGLPTKVPLRLRPHPSDPPDKYRAWITAQRGRRLDVGLDTHATLAEAIGASAWVVGCESFALVVALAAGRRVWTSLPPWAPACRLPHPGIGRLAAPAVVSAVVSARVPAGVPADMPAVARA